MDDSIGHIITLIPDYYYKIAAINRQFRDVVNEYLQRMLVSNTCKLGSIHIKRTEESITVTSLKGSISFSLRGEFKILAFSYNTTEYTCVYLGRVLNWLKRIFIVDFNVQEYCNCPDCRASGCKLQENTTPVIRSVEYVRLISSSHNEYRSKNKVMFDYNGVTYRGYAHCIMSYGDDRWWYPIFGINNGEQRLPADGEPECYLGNYQYIMTNLLGNKKNINDLKLRQHK